MNNLEERTIKTIRFISAEGVQKANSGHPGLPMGAAAAAFALWGRFLKGCGKDPAWPDRDRFVLSAGHGSMLLYTLLHLFGYDLTMEDLKNFRQWGSKTPGHPEYGHTPGVETTTGPLGQGFANAVGMAIAEKRLAAEFNTDDMKPVDHFTYVLAGDGDLMEGVSAEAASLAGHLGLGKLIAIYDDNGITIDGKTDIAFTEDTGKRFEAYGWQVIRVADGNDPEAIAEAIESARKETERPSMLMVKTVIGYGSPGKAGTSGVHGSPLGEDEIELMRKSQGWEYPAFTVPEDVEENMRSIRAEKEKQRDQWYALFEKYAEKYPDKAKKWKEWHEKSLPEGAASDKRLWTFEKKSEATRASGGRVLNLLSEHIENFMGGSADLNASTKTRLAGKGDFQKDSSQGSNINFGIREHAMGGILNGISLHGGFRVFGSTFLVFFDYMKPAVRLSALMKQPVIYVYTHDSIGVGEDGPTHQPIEHLASMRSIPGLKVFRPADAKETVISWLQALEYTEGPSAIVLSRQNLPLLEGVAKAAYMGAHVLRKESKEAADVLLAASGSEVSLVLEAAKLLEKDGIDARVVSFISWEIFDEQTKAYRESVLPEGVPVVAVEAASPMGWHKYTGKSGKVMAMEGLGASAPAPVLMEKFGFTPENIAAQAKEAIKEK
ncbi:MAG: transketolase [Clostridiales bacterium]|nr:MAG: transketolase [Clostridiales bacterium]